jgi:hypothetical protein
LWIRAGLSLRQHVHLLVLRQKLDLDALAHVLPRPFEQRLLQLGKSALGRTDEIRDGRIGRSHFGQHFLGRNASIHHPDALRFAVLGFDLLQGRTQRLTAGCIPWQHLIGKRKTIGRHDQCDHHLNAVASLVGAVPKAAFVILVLWRRRLKIGAGQVIEQHFKLGTEQILPALAQMIEQCLLVLQQFVEAAIERMYLHQPIISAQQVSHRALLEPQPVQAPLAAGIDQPVAY